MSPASTPQGWVLGRIGGAPIVVAPTSVLLGLLIAGSWFPLVSSTLVGAGLPTVLATVLATVLGVAVSVTIHELAHGAAGTALGRRPQRYELYLWGGRTSFGPARGWRPWKDVVTSLSGPAANLGLWGLGQVVLTSVPIASDAVYVALWAVTWVNLALAIFNALPGLPLDGGHALASLVEQVTGRKDLGLRVAGVGGLLVVAWVAWRWILAPLLGGGRPDSFTLILALMVAWPIAASSWRVLGLGSGARAARRLDLRALARPVRTVPPTASVASVREALAAGAGLVLVVDGPRLLGTIDAVSLAELALPDESAVSAAQVCTVLPAAAVTRELDGEAAAEALKRARAVSRWAVIVENGTMSGAVPTGAR